MTGTSTAADGLAGYLGDWHPTPVAVVDELAAGGAQQLAATLDLDEAFSSGDALPPVWQWLYFNDWPPTSALGADGHPRDGHFLPPIPNRRRMFAGGRLTVHKPLRLGQAAQRQSSVTDIRVKSGRTGELLFVTLRHEFHQGGELAMVEEQDAVYRSDAGASTPFARAVEPLGEPGAPWAARPITTPPLLFRFSALTANAHRIHYDEQYTTATEGFPGLVVHGPLLAIYMSELVRATEPGRAFRGFEFRLSKPVFVGDAIEVQGVPTGDTVELAVISGAGTTHASATATFA
jgi:3-methylfumaryl-CoA hydratase